MFSSWNVSFVLLLVASSSKLICGQSNFSFTDGAAYDCSSSLICLGDAHEYTAPDSNGLFVRSLSLIIENDVDNLFYRLGIAYYNKPIRMLDSSARQSTSFNTSFTVYQVPVVNSTGDYSPGDGITFLISANNLSIGAPAQYLGFFNSSGNNSFKSIVVEFDNFANVEAPVFDISDNHVSIDFSTIRYAAAANASDVGIILGLNLTTYAWVEYSAETQQLEVRISNTTSRPISPLLNYTVDLFNVVEEYMWVGFSGANGGYHSFYYIRDWTFESYGVPPVRTFSLTKAKPKSKVVGISVGVPVFLGIAGIIIVFLVRRRIRGAGSLASPVRNPASEENRPMAQLSGMPEEFSYEQLSVATEAFSEKSKLGQGGFGSVYRGVLPTSGIPVAVKKISGDSKQGEKEFMAEVSIISQLRHRNLIQLIGWCRDTGKYLLVYELMPNGSLDKVLFGKDDRHAALSWPQRFKIISGIAAALEYIHHGWKQQVIHRDVKASNIMLDEDWNAKLGDFGLARLVDHERAPSTTMVAGTYGYIAPEAAVSGKFTEKTDVYAFGAVVLEIVCGRKAFASYVPTGELVLVDWVWQRLSEGNLLSVVDERLHDYDMYRMEVVLRIGLLCSHPNPPDRPSIRQVMGMLEGDFEVPNVPTSKPRAMFSLRVASVKEFGVADIRTGPSSSPTSAIALPG